jgi:hypothetical protein
MDGRKPSIYQIIKTWHVVNEEKRAECNNLTHLETSAKLFLIIREESRTPS